jgi:hypothetical protein
MAPWLTPVPMMIAARADAVFFMVLGFEWIF